MAQENFNVSFPNDGLGDSVRNAFIKQQAMNTELYESKVDKITGQGLSENNFTNLEQVKLSGIEEGAQVNVQADWNQTDDEADDFIKNKPEINSTFTIQTSSFTAVNLVAYSTNGTLTVTDPTPETNKGYIVHVIGGTTTIDGVAYTGGALVYRFYNGTVWNSIEYAKKSDLPIQTMGFDFAQLNDTSWAYFDSANSATSSLQGTGLSDINDVSIGFDAFVLDVVTNDSTLKRINFVKNLSPFQTDLSLDFVIIVSDDFVGNNKSILYQNTFSTTNGIIKVNEIVSLSVLQGKFITVFFKSGVVDTGAYRNLKLEFFN